MFNPDLHSLLVRSQTEERHRVARAYNRGRDRNHPPVAPLLKRTISRMFGGAGVGTDEAPIFHGFEVVGYSYSGTPRPRS